MAKTLQEFLTENRRTFTVNDFRHSLEHVADRVDTYLTKVLDALNPLLEDPQQTVANPIYKDVIKYNLSAFVEKATRSNYSYTLQRAVPRTAFTSGEANWDLMDTPMAPVHIKGKLAKIQKALPKITTPELRTFLEWISAVYTELIPLVDAAESLKARVVKRQPKPVEDRKEAYRAPLATNEALRVVDGVLRKMTDAKKNEFAAYVTTSLIGQAERYEKKTVEERHLFRNRFGSDEDISRANIWTYDQSDFGHQHPKLIPAYKGVLAKVGKKTADEIQEAFLFKNVKKLASILEKKPGLKGEPIVKHLSVSGGTFEGDVRIEFQDGSAFDVRNKIVYKYTTYGRPYVQYPTTFHNVMLPNGQAMPMPSEERMNTVFTVA